MQREPSSSSAKWEADGGGTAVGHHTRLPEKQLELWRGEESNFRALNGGNFEILRMETIITYCAL